MRLCVIIPAKNEETVLRRTLVSVVLAGIKKSDIYVINDGSTDKTQEIINKAGVKFLTNPVNIGKAASIRKVTKEFGLCENYDLISLMDADSQVHADYFKSAVTKFVGDDIAAVCGQVRSLKCNWLTAYRAHTYAVTQKFYRHGQENLNVVSVIPGCAATYSSKAFKELEWQSDTLVEDMDVTMQIHIKNLGRIVYQPEAQVFTQDPKTIHDYMKQMNRWFTGTFQIFRKYNILKKTARIDWEFKLLMGEGLVFSFLYLLGMPFLILFRPSWILNLMLFDLVLFMIIALMERRIDIFLVAPVAIVMRVLDSFILARSFINSVLKRETKSWFSVKRYQ